MDVTVTESKVEQGQEEEVKTTETRLLPFGCKLVYFTQCHPPRLVLRECDLPLLGCRSCEDSTELAYEEQK